MRSEAIEQERGRSSRGAMLVVGIMALASAIIGVLLNHAGTALGLSEEHARITSTGFLALGVVDLSAMLVWPRIFPVSGS